MDNEQFTFISFTSTIDRPGGNEKTIDLLRRQLPSKLRGTFVDRLARWPLKFVLTGR